MVVVYTGLTTDFGCLFLAWWQPTKGTVSGGRAAWQSAMCRAECARTGHNMCFVILTATTDNSLIGSLNSHISCCCFSIDCD